MWGTAILFTSLVVVATCEPACDPSRPADYLCHQTDPTKYCVCSWGHAWLMNCPAGLHFDTASITCVYADTADCSSVGDSPAPADDQVCPPGHVGLVPNPDRCSDFFNCTLAGQVGSSSECPYPKMFSTQTNQCEDFWAVTCDGREEIKEPCAYHHSGVPIKPDQRVRRRRNGRGMGPMGPPCTLHDPSCLGLPDGFNPHPWMNHRYIECLHERTMAVHQCRLYTSGQTWQAEQKRCGCPQGTELQPDPNGVLRCFSVNP